MPLFLRTAVKRFDLSPLPSSPEIQGPQKESWVPDRGGAELFQDNWIPHRFYYIKGRRPRCGISRLFLYWLWVAPRCGIPRLILYGLWVAPRCGISRLFLYWLWVINRRHTVVC
jgi:hypothetical protein